MSRVITIPNNRKELTCGHCCETIPKGAGYRWTKPRYGSRKVRCLKASCAFKASDLSSSKAAIIHDAIDDARDQILTAESQDDIQSILADVAETAREVAQEYQDASDAWAGGNGHPDFQERADQCESFADELEGWSFSGEDDEEAVRQSVRDEEDGPEAGESEDDYNIRIEDLCDAAWDERLTEMRDEASDALDSFEL